MLQNPNNYGTSSGLKSLVNMGFRLGLVGGYRQQDRMIHDKYWSMQGATKYSYQGAMIKKIETNIKTPALINPDKTKQNYDDKILSIGTEFGYQPGDVFEWLNTGTIWLVTLQELTELAYFRSEIRRCNYTINWEDTETGTLHTTYAAVRGPVETAIDSIQKNGIRLNNPNYSLNILMPKTEDTLKYFRRYAKFYLQGLDKGDANTCWRIEATDSISMPGVLEITAGEYYANKFEDDEESGVVGQLIAKPLRQAENNNFIEGPGLIHPKVTYEYNYKGANVDEWSWDKTAPIKVKVNERKLQVIWTKTYNGSFIIKCGDSEMEITVDSLF